MEINKAVAQRELQILGGKPKVNRYWNQSEDKNVDVLKCMDVPQKGVQSCATIGVNGTDIGLQSGERQLRVEILGASDVVIESFANIVASVAFDIMDSHQCYPGYIAEEVISQYIPESDMKHVLLTDPFLWENAESLLKEDLCVAWLMMVPISDAEYELAKRSGVEELEKVLEEKEIDIYNINRKSVI